MNKFSENRQASPVLTRKKAAIVAAAEKCQGKPFFSKPVDARIKEGLVEVKHQASHEIEPNWEYICTETDPDFILA